MLRMCRPFFVSVNDFVLVNVFCVAKVITGIKAKGVYEEYLIKKRCYCLKVVPGKLIGNHFEGKYVSDSVVIESITEDNKLFKVFCGKESDYMMKIMASWVTLGDLEDANTRRYFIDRSGTKETNYFTYQNPFGVHYKYRQQVENHNYKIHVPISLERTWATKFWPDRNFSCYLVMSEVNTDLELGHFQNDGIVQPSLYFWRAL